MNSDQEDDYCYSCEHLWEDHEDGYCYHTIVVCGEGTCQESCGCRRTRPEAANGI